MAKLKSYKRIITSDFNQEDRQLVENLGGIVNDSFNELYYVVGGRLELRNNILCTVSDIIVTVNNTGVPRERITVRTNSGLSVIGCQVINAINQTNSAIYPISQPFISFSQTDNGIVINNITGLQPDNRYLIRFIAWN